MRAGFALLLGALACAPDPAPAARQGLEARIVLDRSEARVGDRLGVTIEIDAPPGFEVQPPFPPASPAFVTDAIESSPAPPGTQRHVLLWTLRPREVGAQRLPELSVPFTTEGGEPQQIVLAGLPLRVLSVRAEQPSRDASFDIRPAPPPQPTGPGLWPWMAALALGAGLWTVARRARSRRADPRQLARASLADLAAARAAAPREAAAQGALTLRAFAERRWQLEIAARTAGELGEPIAAALCTSLAALERARFARAPLASDVTSSLDAAVEYLSDVARG